MTHYAEIKNVARLHFEDMYMQREEASQSNIAAMLENIPFKISNEENFDLNTPISEVEIYSSIWSLDPDKSLESNGFTISFYHFFSNMIKTYLQRMLHFSHQFLRLWGNTNTSILELIPKESIPTTFSCFRTISLCNSSYKILTKIIASWLKKILPKIISPNQSGFMEERKIVDNIVLVQ